ncbi:MULTISPECIES: transposase domain-containing protein [unclassified Variovorax]|uniref:Transposase domain-containing protein n=1 Tax=Variovorax gossypii TaxID=1679495 RepID=A0A431TIB2_9BURK|nr:transposase domain-containing protein [Variovorax gossypii]
MRSARPDGHDPYAYLKDVLTRLTWLAVARQCA